MRKAILVSSLVVMGVAFAFFKVKEWKYPFYWSDTPLVFNCATSPYTKKQVESALDYWKKVGHESSVVIDQHPCQVDMRNTIKIDMSHGLDWDVAGQAHIKTEGSEILRVEIYVQYPKERVLEHELGHAFGYKDNNRRGSIMNHIWKSGGWEYPLQGDKYGN